ncbi:MAG: hypothetical protein PHW03_00605 [Eubacteriales bacterium]|nr:hypothetical protein [Eubacteriales bacterium]MDD4389282.1 hypothetical protein [Eubacteriales bacterium]
MKHRNKKAGFSLGELLVVVLVIGLLTGITVTGAGAVKNSYDDIMLRAEADTLLSTVIIKITDELRFAQDIQALGGEISFLSGNSNKRIKLENDETSKSEGIMIVDIEMAEGNPDKVRPLLPKRPLPSGEEETLDPVPAIESIEYDDTDKLFTAVIKIKNNGEDVLEQEIKVSPTN